MEQRAILKRASEIIEEEVILQVSDIEFVCFANFIPYEINVGDEYEVSLGITILDDFSISESTSKTKEIERINDGFEYLIRGKLQEGGKIDVGIILENELLVEYKYLLGKYVEMKVDRISVEFL
ncbi:hypothetical protein PV797_15005 [Clostridiaceae bacterium M8S5]|nr:hypothetical protein PV797_15005 [Clostridiaceae bacterium M8S5]